MLDAALEGLVSHLVSLDGGADLDAARAAFFARTGEVEPGEPWYESRIQAFFDAYLAEHRSADGTRPVERALASDALTEAQREAARACLTAHRSLFRVLDVGEQAHLEDRLGGGRFRVAAEGAAARLRPGDVFDGRLLAISDAILLAPGVVFHPAETHGPLDALLAEVDLDRIPRMEILDGLLRMRMRLDRFTSIRAKHVYRLDALEDREILSAAWAQRSQ